MHVLCMYELLHPAHSQPHARAGRAQKRQASGQTRRGPRHIHRRGKRRAPPACHVRRSQLQAREDCELCVCVCVGVTSKCKRGGD
jgi:hypothetical protein